MLRNLITDEDIKLFYPNIASQIFRNKADYSDQISKAYDILLDDLHNAGISPDLIETIDLTGTNNINPAFISVSSSNIGSAMRTVYERRVIVDTQNITGSITVYIDGCNKTSKPLIQESDWIQALELKVTDVESTYSNVTNSNYQYVRYRIVPDALADGKIALTAITSVFDDCIIHKALAIVLRSFIKEANDSYDYQMKLENDDYKVTFLQAKVRYDEMNTGKLSELVADHKIVDITFVS
jgi:hypothetical protein